MKERCLTERIAKRIRRGQPYESNLPNETILKWARQYGVIRHFNERGLLKTREGQDRCIEVMNDPNRHL